MDVRRYEISLRVLKYFQHETGREISYVQAAM